MFCYSIYYFFIFEIAFPCWVLFNTKRKVVMITLCCLRQFTQSLTKENPKKRKDNDKCVANIELALSLRKFTRSLTQTRDLSPTLRVGYGFISSHLSANQITVFGVVA